MTNWEITTITLMATCSALLLVWDLVVAFFNDVPNKDDTESGIMRKLYRMGFWPLVFWWGVLGGHFFMPGVFVKTTTWYGVSFLAVSTLVVAGLGLWLNPRISHTRWRMALRGFGLMNLGIVEGWLFFPL